MQEITVQQLAKLKNEQEIYLLDVREPFEWDFANIGGVHIPMGELLDRVEELPKDQPIYCLCHHGVRSFQVCRYFDAVGITNFVNVMGGIDAWSKEVDPKVSLY